MIILDTNVISEPLKPRPNPKVLDWLDRQIVETLYVTAVSVAELLVGLEMLPPGKRKTGLAASLGMLLETLLGARILPFDRAAASEYARIFSRPRKTGTISMSDALIAAIAAVHGFAVATRDADPFRGAGVTVINPWD